MERGEKSRGEKVRMDKGTFSRLLFLSDLLRNPAAFHFVSYLSLPLSVSPLSSSALDTTTNHRVAIKKLLHTHADCFSLKRTLREILLLHSLRHPNILPIREVLRADVREEEWELARKRERRKGRGSKEHHEEQKQPGTGYSPHSDEKILPFVSSPPSHPRYPEPDVLYLVTASYPHDLSQLISSPRAFSEAELKRMIYQLLCAVTYLHSLDLLHRDIKPANVLMDEQGKVVLCDFGLARMDPAAFGDHSGIEQQVDGAEVPWGNMTEKVASRWYRAPELLLPSSEACPTPSYSHPVDLWGVGMVFAELLGRKVLFPGRNSLHQLQLIVQVIGAPSSEEIERDWSHLDPICKKVLHSLQSASRRHLLDTPTPFHALYPFASDVALDLLTKLLTFNPRDRIPAYQAMQHPWFEEMFDVRDWPESMRVQMKTDRRRQEQEEEMELFGRSVSSASSCSSPSSSSCSSPSSSSSSSPSIHSKSKRNSTEDKYAHHSHRNQPFESSSRITALTTSASPLELKYHRLRCSCRQCDFCWTRAHLFSQLGRYEMECAKLEQLDRQKHGEDRTVGNCAESFVLLHRTLENLLDELSRPSTSSLLEQSRRHKIVMGAQEDILTPTTTADQQQQGVEDAAWESTCPPSFSPPATRSNTPSPVRAVLPSSRSCTPHPVPPPPTPLPAPKVIIIHDPDSSSHANRLQDNKASHRRGHQRSASLPPWAEMSPSANSGRTKLAPLATQQQSGLPLSPKAPVPCSPLSLYSTPVSPASSMATASPVTLSPTVSSSLPVAPRPRLLATTAAHQLEDVTSDDIAGSVDGLLNALLSQQKREQQATQSQNKHEQQMTQSPPPELPSSSSRSSVGIIPVRHRHVRSRTLLVHSSSAVRTSIHERRSSSPLSNGMLQAIQEGDSLTHSRSRSQGLTCSAASMPTSLNSSRRESRRGSLSQLAPADDRTQPPPMPHHFTLNSPTPPPLFDLSSPPIGSSPANVSPSTGGRQLKAHLTEFPAALLKAACVTPPLLPLHPPPLLKTYSEPASVSASAAASVHLESAPSSLSARSRISPLSARRMSRIGLPEDVSMGLHGKTSNATSAAQNAAADEPAIRKSGERVTDSSKHSAMTRIAPPSPVADSLHSRSTPPLRRSLPVPPSTRTPPTVPAQSPAGVQRLPHSSYASRRESVTSPVGHTSSAVKRASAPLLAESRAGHRRAHSYSHLSPPPPSSFTSLPTSDGSLAAPRVHTLPRTPPTDSEEQLAWRTYLTYASPSLPAPTPIRPSPKMQAMRKQNMQRSPV